MRPVRVGYALVPDLRMAGRFGPFAGIPRPPAHAYIHRPAHGQVDIPCVL